MALAWTLSAGDVDRGADDNSIAQPSVDLAPMGRPGFLGFFGAKATGKPKMTLQTMLGRASDRQL